MPVPVGVALWLGGGALTAKAVKLLIKDAVIQGYQDATKQPLTIDEIRGIHYARNQSQPSDLTYVDVLLGDFKRLSEGKSGLHQLGHKSNRDNSKWVSLDEREEHVFKYVGSAETGGFELDTSDKNIGTYNYRPASDEDGHKVADVYPWLLWGNTPADAKAGSVLQRAAAGAAAFDELRTETLLQESRGSRFEKVRQGSNGIDGFDARSKVEKFKGGGGTDIVRFSNSDHAVAVSLDKGVGQGGTADFDEFVSIENLMGSRFGDILIGDDGGNDLHGGGGRDTLIGLGGRNHLYGGDENDKIYGGSKKDLIEGGEGNDTIYGDYVLVGEPHGKDEIKGGKGRDWVQAGGNDDEVDGGDGKDELYGGAGDDEIRGGPKDDIIDGQGGNDTLIADGGSDTLYGGKTEKDGEGHDTFIFKANAASTAFGEDGDDTFDVKKGGGHILDGGAGEDVFDLKYRAGSEILGGDDADTITVHKGGGHVLKGQAGDDTVTLKVKAASEVYGGDDNDTIIVEAGYNHYIDGGDGYDIVDLRGLDLDKLDRANFARIEEIWVDDVLVTPVAIDMPLVKVFGDHALDGENGIGGYLYGGADVLLDENGSLKVSMTLPSGTSLLKRADLWAHEAPFVTGIGEPKDSYFDGTEPITVSWSYAASAYWRAKAEGRDTLKISATSDFVSQYIWHNTDTQEEVWLDASYGEREEAEIYERSIGSGMKEIGVGLSMSSGGYGNFDSFTEISLPGTLPAGDIVNTTTQRQDDQMIAYSEALDFSFQLSETPGEFFAIL